MLAAATTLRDGARWSRVTALDDLLQVGNISGANYPLRGNYANFNLNHQINIQGGAQGEWEGGFAKM